MGWASSYIEALQRGATVQFRPHGGSMRGKIESGQLVTVVPAGADILGVGDIVLCKVGSSEYLHLVKATKVHEDGTRTYKIGNNLGKINGWISEKNVYGRCVKVER